MLDAVLEVVFELIAGLIPPRVGYVLLALVGIAFLGLAGFCGWEIYAERAEPTLVLVIAIALALAVASLWYAWKGISRPDEAVQAGPAKGSRQRSRRR